jgi:hypothetical protein
MQTYFAKDGSVYERVESGVFQAKATDHIRNTVLCLKMLRVYREDIRKQDYFTNAAKRYRRDLLTAMWEARAQRKTDHIQKAA